MAKLMWICGILLVAAGVALGIVLFVSTVRPGGIDIHTAAILLVGGVLALGLGGVINGQAPAAERRPLRPPVPEPVIPAAAATAAIPEFDPRTSKQPTPPEAEAIAVPPVIMLEEEVSRPTRETIEALEQARQKIEMAFDTRSSRTAEVAAEMAEEAQAEAEAESESEAEAVAEAEADAVSADDAVIEDEVAADDEVADDGQLYVVEERIIRRHPARILSDGTVEAETAEGWMRFENLEHLDEYLDAMEPVRS